MQLAIDCVSDEPGIALAVDGRAALLRTWTTQRNHSVELLPNIERLLEKAQRGKGDIEAVFVDVGPGDYAALRVGVSIAKALAHGLGVPLAGVGRLESDAHGVAHEAGSRRIVAVHRAGRGELAWAAYRESGGVWSEESPPQVVKSQELRSIIGAHDALTGDVDGELAAVTLRAGALVLHAAEHRVAALAMLGHRRLVTGRGDDPGSLVPLYLRAPAIGPQS